MDTSQTSLDNNDYAAGAELVTAGLNRAQTLELMSKDLNFLAGVVAPDTIKLAFPQIHREVWALLCDFIAKPREFFKLALGLPRGHAKTTLVKIFCVFCVVFTDRQFILIISSTASRAENSLSDVWDMLTCPNMRNLFGNWENSVSKNTEPLKVFKFAGRDVILAALGAGSSLRGLNLKNERPDVIICDDIQSAEDKDSEDVANKLLSWMLGTLFKAKSPTGCLYIYIGNMFSGPNCILAKLKESKSWISFIVGAILADGNSIWPELHSPQTLLEELRHDIEMGKPEIWFAEVQNDPNSGISSALDITRVPVLETDASDLVLGGCIVIDLGGRKPKVSDDTTIGFFANINGKWVFRDLEVGVFSPLQCIEMAMKLAFKWNCPYIFVESVAYQSSYLFWFEQICLQREITGFQLFELYPGVISKNARILKFFKQLLSGDIYLHPDVRSAVLSQASLFKPSKTNNKDDILDLGGYLDSILQHYGPMLISAIQEQLANLMNYSTTVEDTSNF